MSEEPEARLLPLLARTVLAGPEGNEFRVPRPEEAPPLLLQRHFVIR